MRVCRLITALLFVGATTARADIYQWRWVDPQNPSLGKVQSNVLCPDGAGVVATAYSYWPYLDLSQAYLKEAELPNSLLHNSVLTAGYFENANLAGSVIWGCEISNADFTSISATHANFRFSTLNGASFAEADLSGATFLVGSMTGVSFQRANLTDAFFNTDLTGVDFTDAVVAGADLRSQAGQGGSKFTAAQLYSTASYKNRDLRRVRLGFNDLSGWDLSYQNLTEATLEYSKLTSARFTNAMLNRVLMPGSDLSHADVTAADLRYADISEARLSNAILTGANFSHASLYSAQLTNAECDGANFTGASLEGADLRGARDAVIDDAATKDRIIAPDGTVDGRRGFPMRIRNYQGDQPIPIRVTGVMDPVYVYVLFDEFPWGSTIEFDPGIPVKLHGQGLQLGFEAGVDASIMIGRTFQLFDWTGVIPVGQFHVSSLHWDWDTSRLYSDGMVTLIPEPSTTVLGIPLALALSRKCRGRFNVKVLQSAHPSVRKKDC